MECWKCQFENPEGLKFCGQCGTRLELVCPNCGAVNPSRFLYCGECGHRLSSTAVRPLSREPAFDEKLAAIEKYLPRGLIEKIVPGKETIEGERRQVTVMFVDMKEFSPLAKRLGPERTFSFIDQVFKILIRRVHEYEGTVSELRGDGILALFGAPIALENHPQSAIRSALAIHREMTRLNEKFKGEDRLEPILLRIGINTGPVVVGTLGNGLRAQFCAVGDTINLAARMEALAEPGTTYVTEDTFRLGKGFFRFEALGEKQVKGRQHPVQVYRVIAPSSRRTRFDVNAEGGLTPFVGREQELQLLLAGFERCKTRWGQAFSITGEAGVGKSRLLYEFRKAVANEDVFFLEAKCLSFHRCTAFAAITDILRSNFRIRAGETDAEIRTKVQEGLRLLRADETSTLPFLLDLLSASPLQAGESYNVPMNAEARKDGIIQAVQAVVQKGSEIRPLIVALEDLHWMDKSSEEILKHILESIAGLRALLVFTYRPEFIHDWGRKSFHNQVNLNRLPMRDSRAMLTYLLADLCPHVTPLQLRSSSCHRIEA